MKSKARAKGGAKKSGQGLGRKPSSREGFEAFAQKLGARDALPVQLTMKEACQLIGPEVDSSDFAATAFQSFAGEVGTIADVHESVSHNERWAALQALSARMRLADRLVKALAAHEGATGAP